MSYFLIHRLPDGTFSHLVPIEAEPVIEDGEIVGYRLTHNAVLEGGPGDGMLMDLMAPTLVWYSPLREPGDNENSLDWNAVAGAADYRVRRPDPGEYRQTDRTDPYGRAVYDWHPT